MVRVCFLIPAALFIASFVTFSSGSYVITIPRAWLPGEDLQVCIQVTNPNAPAGNVSISINHIAEITYSKFSFGPSDVTNVFLPPTLFKVSLRAQHMCESIPTLPVKKPARDTGSFSGFFSRADQLSVTGYLDGIHVNHTAKIHRQTYSTDTIIQTDKELYQPGQEMQFRILSLKGPFMEVSTEKYPEVYVTSPSRTRIAQWLDVDNDRGLVHLSMQLADEPEEGRYTIHVKTADLESATTQFKVEDYVLPRFEVTVKAPKYVLGTDTSFSFTACAKYTFGQPVKGNISWTINNHQSRGCSVELTRNDTISGCSDMKVTSSEIQMTDCRVSRISATAEVSEEETEIQTTGTKSVTVSWSAITFQTLRADEYMKPNLPYTLKVLAKLPDGSPAVGEHLEVCHGGICTNFTTREDGIVRVYLTNQQSRRVMIQKLMKRAVMFSSEYSTEVKKFYSPSNSSLIIFAPEESLRCVSGENTKYVLPVLFAATNQTLAVINVQVISRGQIQYWDSQAHALTASELPIEKEFLLEPLTPTSSDVVTGVVNVTLNLPTSVSPKAKVLVWYVRHDGEVVSDLKELMVVKCLPNRVDLNWATNKTQPGDQETLTLSSEPNSICSLGVVDKSVELVSSRKDSLTVDAFFGSSNNYEISSYNYRQADDYVYCRRKLETAVEDRRHHFNYFSDYVDALKMFDHVIPSYDVQEELGLE